MAGAVGGRAVPCSVSAAAADVDSGALISVRPRLPVDGGLSAACRHRRRRSAAAVAWSAITAAEILVGVSRKERLA